MNNIEQIVKENNYLSRGIRYVQKDDAKSLEEMSAHIAEDYPNEKFEIFQQLKMELRKMKDEIEKEDKEENQTSKFIEDLVSSIHTIRALNTVITATGFLPLKSKNTPDLFNKLGKDIRDAADEFVKLYDNYKE